MKGCLASLQLKVKLKMIRKLCKAAIFCLLWRIWMKKNKIIFEDDKLIIQNWKSNIKDMQNWKIGLLLQLWSWMGGNLGECLNTLTIIIFLIGKNIFI